jgi:hypothetical protein
MIGYFGGGFSVVMPAFKGAPFTATTEVAKTLPHNCCLEKDSWASNDTLGRPGYSLPNLGFSFFVFLSKPFKLLTL